MRIVRERLIEGAARAEGVVVVVDVIRAFTTAAFALAAGPRELRLLSTVEAALAAKALEPGAFLMGEEGGAPPAGFDHGNSPALLPVRALRDLVVLQRTGSGTRCAVAATKASHLYAVSLVVAQATARTVASLSPRLVTIVESGGADEGDDAVADHVEGLLRGEPPPVAETLRRVRECRAAREIAERGRAHSPPQDIACCTSLDTFDFAIRVERREDVVVARRERPSGEVVAQARAGSDVTVREVTSGKGAACENVLRALPDWFGIESSLLDYVRAVERMPMWTAERDGEVVGFLALELKNEWVAEIHVMGVRREHHGQGVGTRLVEAAEESLRARGAEFLVVKTLGPSHKDAGYARTRDFYLARGFRPVEEFQGVWSPGNPCLVMIKRV